MLICWQHSEHVWFPLGKIEDSVSGGPHGRLCVLPLPASAPDHGLQRQGPRWSHAPQTRMGGRGCSALVLNYTAGDPQPTAPPGPSIPLFWILGKGSQFGEGGEKLPKVGNATREHFYMKANNLWKSSGNQYIGCSFSKDRMNSKQLEIIEEQTCKIPS